MPFCSNCGNELSSDAKFCANCGTAVGGGSDGSQRIQKFSGEIKKCPNCGSVLPSGVLKCSECGYEIRDAQASNAAIDFFNKINNAQSEQQKIEIIKKYPIPNTREDIKEFLNRAKAEVESDYNADDYMQNQLHEAWIVCFNNIKNRVKAMPQNDRDEFLDIIGDTAINVFKIKIAKAKKGKDKIELIQSYPIELTPNNLTSFADFIEAQIVYSNPVVEVFKEILLLVLTCCTSGIALLIYLAIFLTKNKMETGTFFDYKTAINDSYLVRLTEIQSQTLLLEKNPNARERISSAIRTIKRKKSQKILTYVLIPIIAILLVVLFFVIVFSL